MRMLVRGVLSPHRFFHKFKTRSMSHITPKTPPSPAPEPEVGAERLGRMSHLQQTADQPRQPQLVGATVVAMWQESPTVKCIKLEVHDRSLTFKSGQWVDLHIPGVEEVGGYSMWSPPSQLAQEGTLCLGVKDSNWPPALWVKDCQVGSQVALRVGGDFHYPPPAPSPPTLQESDPSLPSCPLLLVGGGVGVNPLASILLHLHSLLGKDVGKEGAVRGRLLYSARTYEELLYKDKLSLVCSEMADFKVNYFTTRQPPPNPALATYGHITSYILSQAVRSFSDPSPPLCYLCGPPPMLEEMAGYLERTGVPRNRILYEKWW